MSELATMVQVGFPTHNRWDEVRNTLERLADAGLGGLRVLIVDDGSDQPCPFAPASICPRAELRRYPEARGMVVRRNEIAREMNAPYYLGLDDDSFPVSGSLDDAVHFAEGRDDLLSLAFPIFNPRLDAPQVPSLADRPYAVRAFIGCGHLVRRDRFLALGGYSPVFAYFFEEWELAARGFVQGLRCVHYPGLQVHHRASNAWRDWNRMDFYGARNAVLWNDWYVPPGRRAVKQARALMARMMLATRTGRTASLSGFAAGMRERAAHRAHRRPMSAAQYAEWVGMPFS
ncbi:MAG TPA: glycosyltransferase [Longimicrobium sp.]|uniref:glycosyltransferase family 2 protein n=1 Tax=Longimicrobium sp. TaxID=2029185 RepID=UPI002EDB87FB